MKFSEYILMESRSAIKEVKVIDINEKEDGKRYIGEDGAYVDINEKAKYAPRKITVYGFVVPEKSRGKGIGKKLLSEVLEIYGKENVSAACSSAASVAVFYSLGFRPTTGKEDKATLEDCLKMQEEDSSVTMVVEK